MSAGILRVAAWLVIIVMAAVLAVAVVVPRVGGATPYTILTSSMEPGLPPGTLVVVRPVDPADIGVGTVITYQIASGKPAVVTHRVVGQGVDGDGGTVFLTQGDANGAPDAQPVRPAQIKGEQWYAVPHLGRLTNLVSGSQRQVAMMIVVAGLLGYAATMFSAAARDRSRPRRHQGAVS